MRHSSILFGKNTVTKTASPQLMRIEVEKTLRAFEIGRDCGLFRVPKILEYDESKGVTVFERIHQIRPARSVVNETRPRKSYMDQIGRSLAVIHQELSLPDDMIIHLPSEFNSYGESVCIHGDFNGANVFVSDRYPSIVILDWQMTARHGGQATYGSRFFDVIWFVNYMLWTPSVEYLFRDPVTESALCFVESYLKNAEFSWNAVSLAQYAQSFFEMKQIGRETQASWKTRYLMSRSRVLTGRFIEALKTMESGDK